MSKMANMVGPKRLFCQKAPILCSWDYPILFKFHHLMVKIFDNELQIVFQISNVSNSKGNTDKLERKISRKMLLF